MIEKVNIELRNLIENSTHGEFNKCWTCSSCDTECPINIATNRLRPQKMVRLAYVGLFDELVSTPEIWYCLTCRRCNHVCPNLVKPADVIAYARTEALRTGAVSNYQVQSYFELFSTFQRVRWHAAEKYLSGKLDVVDENQWFKWFEKPIPNSTVALSGRNLFQGNGTFNSLAVNTNASSCFTCGECSSACPISGSRNVFDPRFIFRMANLGMLNEILSSPSIWLCLDCGRCTEACSQLVDGRQIIRDLQKLAIQ
ncbi:MAG: 4Fe-4S dicluster domain-containing protein, partial [Desulfobacterales bacterium]|nr:4Fe-4S dicluster domain-containing protein [Desulfobacterales bacterium]